MDSRPIGIFDSGVGGLTVYKALRKALPHENILYFADSKRAPYGSKSKAQLNTYAKEIVDFLLTKDVKLVVIACNTICATAYETLTHAYPHLPLVDIIGISVGEAAHASTSGHIGIIATEATIGSHVFSTKLAQKNKTPHPKAAPALVPLLEHGILRDDVVMPFIQLYLDDITTQIDTLILGCTHYPFLSKQIGQLYPALTVINPAQKAGTFASDYLHNNRLLNGQEGLGQSTFFTTGDTATFDSLYRTFMGASIHSQQVTLDLAPSK